mgnify:CR=1 FL=1
MRKKLLSSLALIASVTVASVASAEEPTQYFPRAGKPFSSVIRMGHSVYMSGVTGAAADGSIPADFTTQATNAMDAVVARMKQGGATMDDVYKCTIALTDMNDWDAFNLVYVKYFKPNRFPVRMSFGSTGLGGSAVEVQCEAHAEPKP